MVTIDYTFLSELEKNKVITFNCHGISIKISLWIRFKASYKYNKTYNLHNEYYAHV